MNHILNGKQNSGGVGRGLVLCCVMESCLCVKLDFFKLNELQAVIQDTSELQMQHSTANATTITRYSLSHSLLHLIILPTCIFIYKYVHYHSTCLAKRTDTVGRERGEGIACYLFLSGKKPCM